MAALLLALASCVVGSCRQSPSDPKAIFEQAQRALDAHDYTTAEEGFRAVLKIDPHSAAAYSNLGVVYMRRKEYARAVEAFRNAKRLAPQVTGVDLNLGLAYYQQNDFAKALPHFALVVRSDPGQFQARYLLGMCYFLTFDFRPAATTLEPLHESQR